MASSFDKLLPKNLPDFKFLHCVSIYLITPVSPACTLCQRYQSRCCCRMSYLCGSEGDCTDLNSSHLLTVISSQATLLFTLLIKCIGCVLYKQPVLVTSSSASFIKQWRFACLECTKCFQAGGTECAVLSKRRLRTAACLVVGFLSALLWLAKMSMVQATHVLKRQSFPLLRWY